MQTRHAIQLDGTHGEGGGQILRTALFLSVLTRQAFEITDIRKNRPEPGLKPQHAGILQVLRQMTTSEVRGGEVGSTRLGFTPHPPRPGAYAYDIGTAGSIPLFLQTLLPVMLVTPGRTELHLTGGTDVTFGPTIEWVRRAYAPLLAPLASQLRIEVERRGFYPRGGGRVRVIAENTLASNGLRDIQRLVAAALASDRLAWTPPIRVELHSLAHRQLAARRVAERQADAAQAVLGQDGHHAAIEVGYADALSPGSSVTLVGVDGLGNRIAADGLGAQGRMAETVGEDVAKRWLHDVASGATADEHLADHMVPWVALGAGAIRVPRITGHLETNVWTSQQFLGADAVSIDGDRLRGSKNKI